jgi:hypothetical protein
MESRSGTFLVVLGVVAGFARVGIVSWLVVGSVYIDVGEILL